MVGFVGKMPAHGDFVSRRLSQEFQQVWDGWIQRALASSQEQLGSDWLEIYLNSPLWRFVLTPGAIDGQAWIGLLMPSVDKIGRYYPLTFARPVEQLGSPSQLLTEAQIWFETLEDIALAALEEDCDADSLAKALLQLPDLPDITLRQVGTALDFARPLAIPLSEPFQSPMTALPVLVDSFFSQRLPSYSLWWTAGSRQVAPSLLVSPHLPNPTGFAALLNGQWQHWQWNTPFGVIPNVAANAPEVNEVNA